MNRLNNKEEKERYGEQVRIDIGLKEVLKECSLNRIKNNVDEEKRGTKEMTKMMLNCSSFPDVIDQLSKTPRKEDIE